MHVNRQIKFDNGRRKTQQVTADARKNVTALSEQNSRVKKSLPIDIRKLLQHSVDTFLSPWLEI